MNAVKAAIAEDDNHIAGPGLPAKTIDDGFRAWFVETGSAAGADGCGHGIDLKQLTRWDFLRVGNRCDDAAVSLAESLNERILQHLAAAGVGARFKDGPEAAPRVALAHAL